MTGDMVGRGGAAAWWQWGVVYQVYPRSFQDADGDGVGDLAGVRARLGYLARLGVDAVWLSPIFPSPMTDFGYDVSDYCGVDPLFGTLAEFDAVVAEAHRLGLRVILDFVPNHSSDQHPWFQQSRRRAGGKADWYLWADAAPGGGPPNNWLAHFGGSAWTLDPLRGQYYCHSFLPTQPDLNWRHGDVRAAMLAVLRFWLRRGVDGFRVDVMWLLLKDAALRDNPANPLWRAGERAYGSLLPVHTEDQEGVLAIVAAMRAVLEEFAGDRVLIGEIYLPIERLVRYYGVAGRLDGAQLPFNFQLLLLEDWRAAALAGLITRYEAALPAGAWPNWVLGNHDRSRVATRLGAAQARVAAVLLLTLRGTPTLYMGDELGMVDTAIAPDAVRDPAALREPGAGLGRDMVRTPFPWDGSAGRGFTRGTPWLPFGADVPLDRQELDAGSMFALHRRLLALRRAETALSLGALEAVRAEGSVLRYRRRDGVRAFEVALNIGGAAAAVGMPAGVVVFAMDGVEGGEVAAGVLALPGDGAVVVRVGG